MEQKLDNSLQEKCKIKKKIKKKKPENRRLFLPKLPALQLVVMDTGQCQRQFISLCSSYAMFCMPAPQSRFSVAHIYWMIIT